MEQRRPGPSMLTFLALVQKRPGMYLGMADESPDSRLDALELLIAGYAGAVYTHDLKDPGFDQWAGFPSRLAFQFGWTMSQGPIRAIRDASSNDEEAWARFWSLLRDFTDFQPIAE
jgi:hypothetical protein